jgi:protocatechuate 3,4-dioxygenase beta subunit
MTAARPLTRRTVAAALVALPALHLVARAQALRRATPAQTEGPFYPVALPADSDFDLLRNGTLRYAQGEPGWLEGSVTDLGGRPVTGAVIEIWQADAGGHYHHPGDRGADAAFQGFGRVTVDAQGQYRFRTIRPVPYTGRTPHIHLKARLGTRELLTTQVYVAGDARNGRDGLWRSLDAGDRAALSVPFVAGSEGWRATFPVVVAA